MDDNKPVVIVGQGDNERKVMPCDLSGPPDIGDEGWDIVGVIVLAIVFVAGVLFGAVVF